MRTRRAMLTLVAMVALVFMATSPIGASESEAVAKCGGQVATITGTPGPDVLTGTPGKDVIVGLGGNDTIMGLGGNDILCGGNGADVIKGGGGKDRLYGQKGADTLEGGNGDDKLFGGDKGDLLKGGGKKDILNGGPGNDELLGGRGNDTINGDAGADKLRGQAGNDVLDGAAGKDNCIGETEYNCEVVRKGNRINIITDAETQDFPANTPFHIDHGWNCVPDQADCSLDLHTNVDFELYVDGSKVSPTDIELAVDSGNWLLKLWVHNFGQGMTGQHTLRGVWTDSGVVEFERTITVNFI